jgi:hypothetical protein
MIGSTTNIPLLSSLTSGDEVIIKTSIPDFFVQIACGDEDEPNDDFYYVYAKHEKTGWEWELFGRAEQLLPELEPDAEDTRLHEETIRILRVALNQSETENVDATLANENEPRYGGDACMQAIESAGWGKGFAAGNVLKYTWRYEQKGGIEDLRKAQWYLQRLIEIEERNEP